MLRRKVSNVGHTVCHLSTNGIEAAKDGIGRDMRLYVIDHAMKLIEAFGGLRIQINIA